MICPFANYHVLDITVCIDNLCYNVKHNILYGVVVMAFLLHVSFISLTRGYKLYDTFTVFSSSMTTGTMATTLLSTAPVNQVVHPRCDGVVTDIHYVTVTHSL